MQEPVEHPDLAALGSAMRSEWRDDQADATADAAAQWRHSRTLSDWLTERMHRGDRVGVTVVGQRFTGLVEEIGPDLIGLRCAFGRVDVHLVPGMALFVEISDKAHSGGSRGTQARSFHDALYARDTQTDITVGTLHDPEGLDGTLYVGADFVSVIARLGAETVVPLDNVAWVSTRRV